MNDILTTDKDGVRLAEYKGVYSLTSIRLGSDGKMYEQWATYQMGRDKHAEKDWPVKVTLGEKTVAIGALKAALAEIGGEEDDAPF